MEVISFANNFRLQKVLVVAKYADIQLSVSHNLPPTLENNQLLKSNSHDNTPVLITEFGPIIHTNSISRFLAKQSNLNLLGESPYEQAVIDQWIDFSYNEVDLPVLAWLGPIYGFFPENDTATRRAKDDVRRLLKILEAHLKDRTYLASERITLADIVVSLSLYPLYTKVLAPAFRKQFNNTNRWFNTLASQPNFVAVLGEIVLCETPASAGSSFFYFILLTLI
jgi:elongation factor 1-gamma